MAVRGGLRCEAGEGHPGVAVGGRLEVVGTLVIEVAGEVVEEVEDHEAEDHEAEDLGHGEAVEEEAQEVVIRISQDREDSEDLARDFDTWSFGRRGDRNMHQFCQASHQAVIVGSTERSNVRAPVYRLGLWRNPRTR